jgi:hypothetical protein
LSVAAVLIPPGEACIWAEILAAAAAVHTCATSLAQPGNSNPITWPETPAVLAEFGYFTDDFMARNNRIMLRRQVAFGDVEVSAAYAANANTDQQFIGLRPRLFDLDRM